VIRALTLTLADLVPRPTILSALGGDLRETNTPILPPFDADPWLEDPAAAPEASGDIAKP
jgi:hypothetical protein